MNRAERRRLDRENRRLLQRLMRDVGPDEIVVAVWRADDPAPQWFSDNVDGVCDDCGAAVYWRPWVPEGLTKRCLHCMAREGRGEK